MSNLQIILGIILLFFNDVFAQEENMIRQASNQDESGVEEHPRSYEMNLAKRLEPPRPELVDFEDLEGWSVHCFDGADARFMRSKEQKMYGEWTGKVVYSGTSSASRFQLRSPEPIPIPGEFTAVNLWVRGNNWGWINPPATARTNISVIVRDAKDEEYRIDLGQVNFDYWFLMHRTIVSPDGRAVHYQPLSDEYQKRIQYPARFVALEVSNCSNEEPAKLFFDSLTFYEIGYKPIEFDPIPEELPWPTTEDTILPQFKDEVKNWVEKKDDRYLFFCQTDSEEIIYEVIPERGSLNDLWVRAEEKRFQPCANGGIEFELNGEIIEPSNPKANVEKLGLELDNGVLKTNWEISYGNESAKYQLYFRVKGKSLIIDAKATGKKATRFKIGHTKELEPVKMIQIPYLSISAKGPRVVCSDNLFLFGLLDWYNSDASLLYSDDRVTESGDVSYNGGSEYRLKTDGTRNNLRERLFINVSSDFQELLPAIPNPKCDTGDVAKHYLWRNIGAPQPEMLKRFKKYGIDGFIACHHEVGWRDAGESFTMRLKAAPRIGDEGLKEYSELVKSLGYRFGTYTNYVDFAPVNSNWDEDLVALDPEGQWQRAWPRTYALKPLEAVKKEAWYAPRIHEKFSTSAQYCDVHTSYRPWGRTDYDARTPGAGMFRTQFNAYAMLLWNESKTHHGPVFSEGPNQWFYAGIVDGNYGQLQRGNKRWRMFPLVDFDLLQMHPKMTDFGMGMPSMFYDNSVEWREDRSRLNPYLDRFITSTIAFGHIGFLATDWGFEGTLKSYYLLKAIQLRYAIVPVEKIGYFDGERIVDTSQAIITDAYQRRQVYVEYENGLKIWANLSFDEDWLVKLDDTDYLLPPAGFLAYRPDDILEYSAMVDGKRSEYVRTEDYLYLDTRGEFVKTDSLALKGVVAVKPGELNEWWIIPATSAEEITIKVKALPRIKEEIAPEKFEAIALDESEKPLKEAEIRTSEDAITIMPVQGAIKYHLNGGNDK